MKPKFKPRELIWMTLPVLVIGGVAWWKTHQPTIYEIASTPPEDLTQGPIRLVMADWKPQPTSPGDIATGHTLKWGTRFWVAGKARGTLRDLWTPELTKSLSLQYRQGENWRRVQFPGGWNGMRAWMGEGVMSRRLDLAMPMNLVPTNADEVRLRGYLQALIFERISGRDTIDKMRSLPIDLLIKTKGENLSTPQVSHESPLKVEQTTIQLSGDAANDERTERSNAFMQVKLRWNHSLFQREKPLGFATQKVELLDDKGHDWMRHLPAPLERPGSDNIGGADKLNQHFFGLPEEDPTWAAEVQTSQVPTSAGELRLRALVAPEWENGYADWPVQIECIVRPRWLTRPPHDLKVQKVSVIMQHAEGAPYALTPVVSVELLYTSPNPVFARGVTLDQCGWSPDPKAPKGTLASTGGTRNCWDESNRVVAQIPSERGGFGLVREAKAGENELIVNWNQHLEDKLTSSILSDFTKDIIPLEPEINKDRITAKYELMLRSGVW